MRHAIAVLLLGLVAMSPLAARQAPAAGPIDAFVAQGRLAVSELAAKTFDKFIARLDPKVGSVLTEQKLAALWSQITGQSGEFKSIVSARVEDAQGAHVVTLTCAFDKQNLGLRVAFNDDQKIVGFFIVPPDPSPTARRPQDPMGALPYREEEVGYASANPQVRLAGTLTIPAGNGPFPGVLLVTGSGAQDRNETIAGHRPFLVMSDYLTRRGIAVLRVDDRGVGTSTGSLKGITTADLVEDARAGLQFLKTRGEIDRARIGLVGHSEGGAIASALAAKNPDVAFIVMLAGPGVPGLDIVPEQVRLASAMTGATPEQSNAMAAMQRELLNQVVANASTDELKTHVRAMSPPGTSDLALDVMVSQLTSPWYRYFLSLDPAVALTQVTCRVLALNGEKDIQVPAAQNLPAIRRALESGGNTRAEVIQWPGVNHLFQTAKTGLPGEYSQIEETFASAVLEKIAAWILQPVISPPA